MTDLRAAVVRLLNEVHDLRLEGGNSSLRAAVDDVRAALAQPAPAGEVSYGDDWFTVALLAQDMRSRGLAEQMAGDELLKMANISRRAPVQVAEGEAPAAWLYKGEPDFDGANWRENWCVTTNQQVAQFHAQPDSPVPLFRRHPAPAPVSEPQNERSAECVESWPDCYEGGYDPRCCRFPKSCSCTIRPNCATPRSEKTNGFMCF